MASKPSILSDIGNFFKKIFTSPITKEIETGVQVFAQSPLAALVLSPEGAALLTNAVTALENAEMASITAGQQSGSGATKAALVAAALQNSYNTFAAAQKPPLPVTPASLQEFISAFVAVANSFPPAASTPPIA